MRTAMAAIIKKDLKSVMDNRRMFASLLIVPLVLVVFLPSLFLIMLRFAPADPDMQKMLELLPAAMRQGDWQQAAAGLMVNFLLPSFFLMIPVMTASIMAASAFVGEKEKHTLETLLYCPLSVRQIFRAKVMASFLLSMLVSLISFAVMLLVTRDQLAGHSGAGFPGHFSDCGNADRAGLGESPDRGGIPAERRFSDSACHPSGGGADHRTYAGKRLGAAGAGCCLWPDCFSDAEDVHGTLYLRDAFKISFFEINTI